MQLNVDFMELPTLALDNIFIYLSDQDLRGVHQVCRKWKGTLESKERQGDNDRRKALVHRIRENKENIPDKAKGLEYKAGRVSRERPVSRDSKEGYLLLNECTNVPLMASTPDNSKDAQLTPTSILPFQAFEESEKSLSAGQQLFQCRRCRGPVPSPILSGERPAGNSSKIESTRCRLITRMEVSPETTGRLVPERKKSKPLPAIDTPTTLALSDIMSQSLVISGAGNKSVNSQPRNCIQNQKNLSETWSPVAINLSLNSEDSRNDSIDFRMDCTNLPESSSFGILKSFSNYQSPCSSIRSVESGLNVTAEADSLLGDSGIFQNLILSPIPDSDSVNSTSSSRQTKTTLFHHPQDFIKPNTLKNSSRIGPFSPPSGPYRGNNSNTDIFARSKFKSKNAYNAKNTFLSSSKLNMSLIVCDDTERILLGTNIATDQANPSFAESGNKEQLVSTISNDSGNTSDYYSHGSILRQESVDSKSFIPESFSRRAESSSNEMEFASCEFKFRSQSLGNMTDLVEDKYSSFESFSSCPDLNSSFVLECPNPNCSYRFCSSCLDAEHPGRVCRVIDGNSIEELHQTSRKPSLSPADANKGKGKGKAVAKPKGKESLRRLARL